MQEYIDANNDLDIKIINEEGKTTSFKRLQSNIIVVIFFTTWCPGCPLVLKQFDDLLNKIREKDIKNIKIIALNIGDEDINDLKIHYKSNDIQLLDVYQSVDNSITNGIAGVPACLVFNTKGKLVWGYLSGGVDFSSDEFLNNLEAI
jgi:peroxiredoxin